MKQMDGLQNFGLELKVLIKIFEVEANKIHPAGKKAVEFCNNYINMNKALYAYEFFKERFPSDKKYTITVITEIFPFLYMYMLQQLYPDSKVYVITKQYTAHKLKSLLQKHFPNMELFDKHPIFDKEIEWYFDQSDFVFIPDSDYLLPFVLLDHFKFKNALVFNFKDPHERKTNNNIAYSHDELLELCDFSTSHEHYTHKVPPSGNDFFNNNRLFWAFGDRLYGK